MAVTVTVVHNDTDGIKYQLKILRDGLRHVKPRVEFKSCCVWEFTDRVFNDNRTVLVIISKTCESFRKVLLKALETYKGRCSKILCRVCVVFESDRETIEEDFDCLVGKANTIVVDDLFESMKWLPKVCSFLFKTKRRDEVLTCVMPKVGSGTKVRNFRENLLESLRELDIVVSEEFDNETAPRCCVLFKTGDGYCHNFSRRYITTVKHEIRRSGKTIIEYNPSCPFDPEMKSSYEVIYGRDNVVLLLLHILHVMEVVKVKTVMGHRLRKIKKPSILFCGWSYNSVIPSSLCQETTGIRNVIVTSSIQAMRTKNIQGYGGMVCNVSSCCFMPEGGLIIQDSRNDNTIRVFDCQLMYKRSSWPYRFYGKVAVVDSNNIVCFKERYDFSEHMYKYLLCFIQVLPSFDEGLTIDIDVTNCLDVAVAAGRIFILCYNTEDEAEIRVYDLKGRYLRQILGLSQDGSSMFRQPKYMTVNRTGNKLFVSDWATDTVSCLTTKGEIVYQYRDDELGWPSGLHVDDNDNVIVCGYASSTVQIITSAGKKHKTVLSSSKDGVFWPRCVSFRPSDGTLVVGIGASEKLLVYKLS